jgi:hypothetical protein
MGPSCVCVLLDFPSVCLTDVHEHHDPWIVKRFQPMSPERQYGAACCVSRLLFRASASASASTPDVGSGLTFRNAISLDEGLGRHSPFGSVSIAKRVRRNFDRHDAGCVAGSVARHSSVSRHIHPDCAPKHGCLAFINRAVFASSNTQNPRPWLPSSICSRNEPTFSYKAPVRECFSHSSHICQTSSVSSQCVSDEHSSIP